ncbi:MAG: polysaccharide biosynthesis C-terminal domain-containing protein [Saprospiraceae bacterium]|nr:polysaccharide biosynthesis C-terminal domain-containing protein [Saprospiraceae bacterium]
MPKYGIIGAAIATAISYVVFNVLKYFFVQFRFGFSLHFGNHILIIFAGIICFIVLSFVQPSFHPIVNLCLKSITIATIYGLLMYFLNPGGEIRQIVYENLNKLPFIRRIRS